LDGNDDALLPTPQGIFLRLIDDFLQFCLQFAGRLIKLLR